MKGVQHALALNYLQDHVAITRLAAFGNGVQLFFVPLDLFSLSNPPDLFSAFAPVCFGLATSLADNLFKKHPKLERLFPGAWTSAIFELGPQYACAPAVFHFAVRWCWMAITALGNFDADAGGHLILWDTGRVLRFPSGSTVLIPPLLRFSIASIQPGETRYSLIQYAASSAPWARWPAATFLFRKLHTLSTIRT
ncbi:hypothetical protein C8R43DRAFT_909765 [Mycena crocata]|nr:hypothetical protein C8R43DRAFT_909765 [Mycena crocata]